MLAQGHLKGKKIPNGSSRFILSKLNLLFVLDTKSYGCHMYPESEDESQRTKVKLEKQIS